MSLGELSQRVERNGRSTSRGALVLDEQSETVGEGGETENSELNIKLHFAIGGRRRKEEVERAAAGWQTEIYTKCYALLCRHKKGARPEDSHSA